MFFKLFILKSNFKPQTRKEFYFKMLLNELFKVLIILLLKAIEILNLKKNKINFKIIN